MVGRLALSAHEGDLSGGHTQYTHIRSATSAPVCNPTPRPPCNIKVSPHWSSSIPRPACNCNSVQHVRAGGAASPPEPPSAGVSPRTPTGAFGLASSEFRLTQVPR